MPPADSIISTDETSLLSSPSDAFGILGEPSSLTGDPLLEEDPLEFHLTCDDEETEPGFEPKEELLVLDMLLSKGSSLTEAIPPVRFVFETGEPDLFEMILLAPPDADEDTAVIDDA